MFRGLHAMIKGCPPTTVLLYNERFCPETVRLGQANLRYNEYAL